MIANFEKSLAALKSATANIANSGAYADAGEASVQLLFSNGSRFRADYWRIVKSGRAGVSTFDHGQKYGLPVPIDALQQLEKELQGKRVHSCTDAF
jgi:hypothetical protein